MENQKPGTSEEIDLGQLLQKFTNGFRNAWMGFIRFLALIRRIPIENRTSFLGIIGVSIGLSIAYGFSLKKNYYESTMIISSQYLNKRLVDNAIEKLDALAEEDDHSGLAKLFHIPDSTADEIIGLETRPFISESDLLDLEMLKEQLRSTDAASQDATVVNRVLQLIELENRHSFEITIRTLNPTVITGLQDALVGYLRSNDYVQRRIEITRTNLEERRVKLLNELKKLDSLKIVIYANYKSMAEQSRNGSNNVILSDRAVVNPVDIYLKDMDLYNDLQTVNRELYLNADFEIVDGFTEFSEPASPSIAIMSLWALLFGVVVAYLDVAVRSFNRYLESVG